MAALLTGGLVSEGPALADDDGTLDRAGLDRRVNRWVHLFRGAGLAVGDRVAIVCGNRQETVEAVLACLHAGLVVVPVNWHLTGGEIDHLVSDSGARAVLVDPERAANMATLGERLPECRLVTGSQGRDGFSAVEPALAGFPDDEPGDQRCGALMPYTAGTTGRPRGVRTPLLPLGEPVAAVPPLLAYLGGTLGLPRTGRVLLAGPWYHSAQLFFALFPLLRGCGLVVRSALDPAATLTTIDREGITACHLVPTQFVRLLRLPAAVRGTFSGASLQCVWHGGGPCPPVVKRQMIEWWGPVLVEYYGATEAGIATTIDSIEWLRRPGSVGRPVRGTRLHVVDDAGAELSAGEVGTVYVQRPPARDFSYHDEPAQTRAAHRAPGEFTCGDVGRLDDDGYLYLTGRSAELIVTGGVNVYPAEVEAALLEHPAVRDAAVVGAPDEEYGERVTALLELQPDALPDGDLQQALDRHCRLRLAGFKVPRDYQVVAALPRDPNGKLRRRALLESAPS
jgi:long-chain acyl-CoA synthetase